MKFFFFLFPALILFCGVARADGQVNDLTMTRNDNPNVCAAYSLRQAQSPGPLVGPSGEIEPARLAGQEAGWHTLDRTTFRQENPSKYDALLQESDDYIIYKSLYSFIFFRDGAAKQLYLLGYKSEEGGKQKPAELLIQEDGSTLAEGLRKLDASDLVIQAARVYPVVIRQDRVLIYEIDTDMTDNPAWEKRPFMPKVICEFTHNSAVVTETKSISLGSDATPISKPAPVTMPQNPAAQAPAASEPTMTGQSSGATSPPAPTALPAISPNGDPCAQYQSVNPAFYANCESRMNRKQ